MKRILALAIAALLAGSLEARAGVPLSQVPGQGSVLYMQLPDGTFSPVKTDANGNPGASWTPRGYVQVSVSSTAVGITPPANATWCAFRIETNAVRWRDDGTAPTATVGFPESVGDTFVYSGSLSAIKFIRQSADAALDGTCY